MISSGGDSSVVVREYEKRKKWWHCEGVSMLSIECCRWFVVLSRCVYGAPGEAVGAPRCPEHLPAVEHAHGVVLLGVADNG